MLFLSGFNNTLFFNDACNDAGLVVVAFEKFFFLDLQIIQFLFSLSEAGPENEENILVGTELLLIECLVYLEAGHFEQVVQLADALDYVS